MHSHIILAGYVCVVRPGIAQDQPLQHKLFCLPFPSLKPRPNIRVVKKIIKIVLGLEAEPHQGTTHYWGLPYQLVTSGAHSNKQTNKTSKESFITHRLKTDLNLEEYLSREAPDEIQ